MNFNPEAFDTSIRMAVLDAIEADQDGQALATLMVAMCVLLALRPPEATPRVLHHIYTNIAPGVRRDMQDLVAEAHARQAIARAAKVTPSAGTL